MVHVKKTQIIGTVSEDAGIISATINMNTVKASIKVTPKDILSPSNTQAKIGVYIPIQIVVFPITFTTQKKPKYVFTVLGHIISKYRHTGAYTH